jgi:hypothetical protein
MHLILPPGVLGRLVGFKELQWAMLIPFFHAAKRVTVTVMRIV